MHLDKEQEKAFQEVLKHRTMLAAYIRAIIHDPFMAEDTAQDALLEIVNCWDTYDQTRPFGPWARGVARRVALVNLRKSKKGFSLLDEEVLEALAAEIDGFGDQTYFDERLNALERCIGKLTPRNRELLRMRYFENKSYSIISQSLDRSAEALYTAFSRMHENLKLCIEKVVSEVL